MEDRRVKMDTASTVNAVRWLFDLTANIRLVSRITGIHPNTIKDIVKDIDTTVFGKKLYEKEIESLRILSYIKQGVTAKKLCEMYNTDIKNLNARTACVRSFLEEMVNVTPSMNDKLEYNKMRDSETKYIISLIESKTYTMTQIADMYEVGLSAMSRRIMEYKNRQER